MKPEIVTKIFESRQKMLNGQNDYEYFAIPWIRFKVKSLGRDDAFSDKKVNAKANNLKQNMKIMKDDLRYHTAGWMTIPFNFLYNNVEEFVWLCHQYGIIDHWYEMTFIDTSVEIVDEPIKLTMAVLSAGFSIWLASVIVAFTVFIAEHIHFNMKERVLRIGKLSKENICKFWLEFKCKVHKILSYVRTKFHSRVRRFIKTKSKLKRKNRIMRKNYNLKNIPT